MSSVLGDVTGDGQLHDVDDIQVDCGCSAGTDPEEYYTCQEYVSTYVVEGGLCHAADVIMTYNRLESMIFPMNRSILAAT